MIKKDTKSQVGISKPTVPEVLPLVIAYCSKEENSVGGSLHIVLDDGNVEDGHVEYCIEYAKEVGDVDGVKLGKILLKMSKTQRLKLVETWY
jgi:hypothetical protein